MPQVPAQPDETPQCLSSDPGDICQGFQRARSTSRILQVPTLGNREGHGLSSQRRFDQPPVWKTPGRMNQILTKYALFILYVCLLTRKTIVSHVCVIKYNKI